MYSIESGNTVQLSTNNNNNNNNVTECYLTFDEIVYYLFEAYNNLMFSSGKEKNNYYSIKENPKDE